jgi:hypothetical protein
VSRRSLGALAAAFAALAALVAAGAFTGIDQWAVDHAMPGASFHHGEGGFFDGLVPLYHSRWSSGYSIAANLVTLPASFLIALAIVFRRSRTLAVALLAAVAVETICKATLDRPALHEGSFHIGSFDSSFPSGHMLRTVLVGAALWPRERFAVVGWAILSVTLLLLAGWHTPSDLAGGVVLGGLGAGAAGALRRRRLAGA